MKDEYNNVEKGIRRHVAKKTKTLTEQDLRDILVHNLRQRREKRLQHFLDTGDLYAPRQDKDDFSVTLSVFSPDEAARAAKTSPIPRNKPAWLDRILLLVEGIAVIALVFVLFNGFSMIRNINQEFASLLNQPELTPTPLIGAVVLPSGHTFSGGAPVPNEAEIPEHLRPIVQAMAEIPLPTQSPQQAMRIQISAIDIDAPIVQGDGWEQLKKGVGQHIGSAIPGTGGNLILSAHNDIYGEIFRDLDQLEPGDTVRVFTSQTNYEYVVLQTQIVEPTEVSVLNQTIDPILTLISCYPYGVNNQRIIITAKLNP